MKDTMPKCPCCSGGLLHHFQRGRSEWFCTHCWQVMPNWVTQTSTEAALASMAATPEPLSPQPVDSYGHLNAALVNLDLLFGSG